MNVYERRSNYLEALRAVDKNLNIQIARTTENAEPDCTPMVEFLRLLIETQMETGVDNAQIFSRMLAALASKTGRVEVAVPPSLIAATMQLADEFEDSRQAAIKRGERAAYLYLDRNDEIRRLDPRKHDGATSVSNEQALRLLQAGATW